MRNNAFLFKGINSVKNLFEYVQKLEVPIIPVTFYSNYIYNIIREVALTNFKNKNH